MDLPEYRRAGTIVPQEAPRKSSAGFVLLGVFPFLLVGSVLAAGALEESGNRFAGWLWIPFAGLVMFAFAIIHYRLTIRIQHRRFSWPEFSKSVAGFIGMQILVLLVLGLIAMGLARLSPFSSVGNDW